MEKMKIGRSLRRFAFRMGCDLALVAVSLAATAGLSSAAAPTADAAKPASAEAPAKPEPAEVPTENPLSTADRATQEQALSEAWLTFERSCRPCHGNLGTGDGPYAHAFPRDAADLRRPSRAIVADAIRFSRIRDGAASLDERPWESSMPAFGDDLDAQQIWGLVLLLEEFGKESTGLDPNATSADIYASRCAVCHGATGAGDGPLAAELMPPPRNFVRGPYRIRSTESGAPPISNDILVALNRGLGNTAMGRFVALGTQPMEDVSKHVETFATVPFSTDASALALGSPPLRQPIPELTARGRAVYDEARCGECHGKGGRGDGPASATLKDEAGRPLIATNLTKRWHLKTIGAPGVFKVLSTGLNGTPMGSYATLSADDRWAVGYYLERLGRNYPRFSPTVQAGIVTEKLPTDPTAAFWKTIPATSVPLVPQVEVPPYWTQPSIDAVDVTVAVNAEQIGILLVWDDRTRDAHNEDSGAPTVAAALARYGSWRLPDQIAVQFPEKIDPKGILPPSYLGAVDRPVVRWIWSADRQERGEPQAVIERVGGPRSTPAPVADGALVQTTASYVDGQWRVVLLSKRPPKTVASTPIALQSWDGSTGETGRWHSLSGWLNLKLR